MINCRKTRTVKCGDIFIGSEHPVCIQSMTNTYTRNVDETVSQINELVNEGCEIVRVAVLNEDDAYAIAKIKERVHVPLVADIHFDYRLALIAIESGIDKLRLNPGNIGNNDRVKKVVEAAKDKNISIRIGVNTGSLSKEHEEKYGVSAKALVESAMEHVRILEELDFRDIVISLKASDVSMTYQAYSMIADMVDYPLHLGVTEAGTKFKGTVKSAMGIGALLLNGIGDTIRVSLTDDPVKEIEVAKEILQGLKLRKFTADIVSCPTCGRCQIDLIKVAKEVDEVLKGRDIPLKIAIMGCAVNGPGEAKEADIGIAGGKGSALLFKKGKIIRKIPEDRVVEELLQEIENML